MTRRTAPIYILAHPGDMAGCGYHRILKPMTVFTKTGYAAGRADVTLTLDDRLQALSPDVVIWQRQLEEVQIEAIRRTREILPDAYQVYELDDCLSAVPEWSVHKSGMPHKVDERIARAVALCDAVTVTTRDLANHMRDICAPGTDIRIVPNMLSRDEMSRASEIRTMKPGGTGQRIRIGWGGGHSHNGDLDLIIPVMRELHNRADFVFLGQKPDTELPCEFHQGVPPEQFLSTLAGLRFDIVLAPLVDCKFNRCKSNLRLLEAGAFGVPVIASPVSPYLTDTPPVFYADSTEDWIKLLTDFMENRAKYLQRGDELQRWVQRRYIMEDRVEERVRQWLPRSVKPFVPKQRAQITETVILATGMNMTSKSKYRVVKTLGEATELLANVLYVRPGTTINDDQIARLVAHLGTPQTSSVVPMSNDGGQAGFPRMGQFTPMIPEQGAHMDEVCKELFAPVRAELTNPAGPVILLSKQALDICGTPDLLMEDTEAAIFEWGVVASARGFQNVAIGGVYVTTAEPHYYAEAHALMARCQIRYQIKNLPPDPMAPVRYDLELEYHRRYYKAPLPSTNLSYAEWFALFGELDQADLSWMAANTPDVGLRVLKYPVTKEDLLAGVTGEPGGPKWALLTRDDTVLAEHAPYVFASEIAKGSDPQCVVYYADHDHLSPDGSHDQHDFKPRIIDRHLLLQRDYVTPVFAVFLPTLLERADELPDLIMETAWYGIVLDTLARVGPERFRHIPRVLAHLKWPQMDKSLETTLMKISEANKHTVFSGAVVKQSARFPFLGELSYAGAVPDPAPKVSVIMPTAGKTEILSPGLASLLLDTDYPNMEVIVVENGPKNFECHSYLTDMAEKHPNLRVVRYEKPYNWAALNNWAANKCDGQFLLFLNDDTRVVEPGWLKEMVGAAMQPHVGAVGARLTYLIGAVQHVGVVCRRGLSGHLHKGLNEGHPGYNGIAALSHEATAVTGACLLIDRAKFEEVGMLNEQLAHNFNDVAICLDLFKLGYRMVVANNAVLHHLEGVSRTSPLSPDGNDILRKESIIMGKLYGDVDDPYWNPNLMFAHSEGGSMVTGLNCDVLQWPPEGWDHRNEDWPHENVLLIGDDGTGWVSEARKGNTLYFAMMSGYGMQLGRPTLANVPPFDIRESAAPQEVVQKLGINKIIVRSVLGGSAEVLPFLTRLGLPIEYRPTNGEAICPRTDFQTAQLDGTFAHCREGWKRGECQTCLERCGSPFGCVSIAGWRDQWRRFLQNPATSMLTSVSDEVGEAVTDMYPQPSNDMAE